MDTIDEMYDEEGNLKIDANVPVDDTEEDWREIYTSDI